MLSPPPTLTQTLCRYRAQYHNQAPALSQHAPRPSEPSFGSVIGLGFNRISSFIRYRSTMPCPASPLPPDPQPDEEDRTSVGQVLSIGLNRLGSFVLGPRAMLPPCIPMPEEDDEQIDEFRRVRSTVFNRTSSSKDRASGGTWARAQPDGLLAPEAGTVTQ